MTEGTIRTKTVAITFEDSGPVSAKELSSFFYLFRAIYVAAITNLKDKEPITDKVQAAQIIGELGIYGSVTRFFKEELPKNQDLFFYEIDKHSPLELIANATAGCMGALTAAVIFSGGTADLKNMRFTIPSLGSGIQSMWKAVKGPSTTTASSGAGIKKTVTKSIPTPKKQITSKQTAATKQLVAPQKQTTTAQLAPPQKQAKKKSQTASKKVTPTKQGTTQKKLSDPKKK